MISKLKQPITPISSYHNTQLTYFGITGESRTFNGCKEMAGLANFRLIPGMTFDNSRVGAST